MPRHRLNYAPRRQKDLSVAQVARIVLILGMMGLLALAIAVPLRARDAISILGPVGCLAAFFGAGVGIWGAIRMLSLYVLCVTVPAIAATAGWVWLIVALMRR